MKPQFKVVGSNKADEAAPKGEVWAVVRALLLLVGGILVFGYIIA